MNISVASSITLVKGYSSANCLDMVLRMIPRGGHSGISFSFMYKKFIQVAKILEIVEHDRLKR